MTKQVIYQFYAELSDYKYGCNRRFQIKADRTMSNLAYTLMTMFEMKASHLFRFMYNAELNFITKVGEHITNEINQKALMQFNTNPSFKMCIVELPNEYMQGFERFKTFDASETLIKDLVSEPNEFIDFEYDFGDSWMIHLVLEEIIVSDTTRYPTKMFPKVIDGKGYGIIEDCGSIPGLESIYRAFEKKSGKKYDEFVDWLGTDQLDMKSFDLEEMNVRLKKIPRLYQKVYEEDYRISESEYQYLERL